VTPFVARENECSISQGRKAEDLLHKGTAETGRNKAGKRPGDDHWRWWEETKQLLAAGTGPAARGGPRWSALLFMKNKGKSSSVTTMSYEGCSCGTPSKGRETQT